MKGSHLCCWDLVVIAPWPILSVDCMEAVERVGYDVQGRRYCARIDEDVVEDGRCVVAGPVQSWEAARR